MTRTGTRTYPPLVAVGPAQERRPRMIDEQARKDREAANDKLAELRLWRRLAKPEEREKFDKEIADLAEEVKAISEHILESERPK